MKVELNKVYKDGRGRQWKVFCIVNPITVGTRRIYATNETQTKINRCCVDGANDHCYSSTEDLVELVGNDFKREPIKITFSASIDSCSSDREKGVEVVTLSTHKHTTRDFEVWEALNKMGFGSQNCRVTIEEEFDE